MNRLEELEAKLAAEVEAIRPSPGLENVLLKEFDAHRRPSRLRYWGLAAAASVVLGLWLMPRQASPPPEPHIARAVPAPPVQPPARPVARVRRKSVRKKPVEPEPEFVRIPFSPPIAPYERTEIVRMDLPVAALTAAGFNVTTPDTSATAQADLLIGEDGMAHAVRLISIRSTQR